MQATAAAIENIVRLRTNGFSLDFADETNEDLGILAIATKGDTVVFVYPDGGIDDVSPMVAEEDGESYEEWVRGEYIQAIGA